MYYVKKYLAKTNEYSRYVNDGFLQCLQDIESLLAELRPLKELPEQYQQILKGGNEKKCVTHSQRSKTEEETKNCSNMEDEECTICFETLDLNIIEKTLIEKNRKAKILVSKK